MKSILQKTSPLVFSFLLILSVGLFFSFSNSEKRKTEYLSIVVDYSNQIQCVNITEGTSTSKRIAIVSSKSESKFQINRLKKLGYEIVRKHISNQYDNQYVFELLQQYEAKGWELNSHNFSVGKSNDNERRMSFYLFTK